MTARTAHPDAYQACLDALAARGRFGIRLGLGRTRALLRALGDPQDGIGGALVAGTNGKGSVQAMVAAMLTAAGLRVGQAPKPHLVDYTERLVLGGAPIDRDEFVELIGRVSSVADRVSGRLGPATEFEVVTAAAFDWFARRGCDLAVVEVGMGGRLDATNSWDGGVAIVTGVAMDHAEWLGPTIPAIAREKAAIIKRGDLAATGADGEALAVIRRRARRLGVPLVEVGPLEVLGMNRDGLRVSAAGLGDVRVGLLGRHQALNAAVALATVDALETAGLASVPDAARRHGLAGVRWPGRLELLRVRGVDVLLDGAHNAQGMTALGAAVEELRSGYEGPAGAGGDRPVSRERSLAPGRPTLVVAVMRDKELDAMFGALVGQGALAAQGALAGAAMIATRVPVKRAMEPSRLADAWGRAAQPPGASAETAPIAVEAFERGLERARREGGPLVVAGSLYLVGAIRRHLLAMGDLEP